MDFSFHRTKLGDDAIIKDIAKLAGSNAKELGFLPASVIGDRCRNGHAYVCMQGDALLGYILFSHQKRTHGIKILQFCVAEPRRREGIATALFKRFKEHVANAFSIALSCRNDSGSHTFLINLGFTLVNWENDGTSDEPTALPLFRYPIRDDLLNPLEQTYIRPKVLLDSALIPEMDDEPSEFTENNSLLLYSNDVLFCIASAPCEDALFRKSDAPHETSLGISPRFKSLSITREQLAHVCAKLAEDVPELAESDRRQLACAVANRVKCFVTTNQRLLDFFQQGAEKYGVMLYSPTEFYANIDSILNRESVQTELFPALHGTVMTIRLDENNLCSKFVNIAQGETRQDFIGTLQRNKENATLKSVVIGGHEYGFLYYSIENNILTVHLLRTNKATSSFAQTAATFILSEVIRIAACSGAALIRLEDAHANPHCAAVAQQLGFQDNKKLSLRFIGTQSGYRTAVKKALPKNVFSEIRSVFGDKPGSEDIYAQVERERAFFPAKYIDMDIPNYVIPIKPLWARDLITPEIISQHSLFASDAGTILLRDPNVYYMSGKARVAVPGRILWYVTSNASRDSQVRWTRHIIAASYLDAVHSGAKEEIFKKFWKTGISRWADLSGISGRTCTALVFSQTELFMHKLSHAWIADVIQKTMRKDIAFNALTPISSKTFMQLYKQGKYELEDGD